MSTAINRRTGALRLTTAERPCSFLVHTHGHIRMPEEKPALAELEESIRTLEKLVEELESGELPLEKALSEFERGVRLTRRCQAALAHAQQRIEILLKDDEEPVPFEESADSG
jgi:exodeoxyribonuclease VII small subunit